MSTRIARGSARVDFRLATSTHSILLVVSALLVIFSSCTSVQSREDLSPDDRWSYTVRQLPGRSDRQRGELSFRNYRLPDYFSEVVVGSRRFEVALQTVGDGFEGYREGIGFVPPDRGSAMQAAVGEPLTAGERTRGWYLADLESRRQNTPETWIWVRRENLEAWVNPQRIEAFATSFQLARMHERNEPRFQLMFSYGFHGR